MILDEASLSFAQGALRHEVVAFASCCGKGMRCTTTVLSKQQGRLPAQRT